MIKVENVVPFCLIQFGIFVCEIKLNFTDECVCSVTSCVEKYPKIVKAEQFCSVMEEFDGVRYDIIEFLLSKL